MIEFSFLFEYVSIKYSKSKLDISIEVKSNVSILFIVEEVYLLILASSENPPDKVAPLKEHLFIIKYCIDCCNVLSFSCKIDFL